MRRLIVPVIAASFVGALLVGHQPLSSVAPVTSTLRGATIAGSADSAHAAGQPGAPDPDNDPGWPSQPSQPGQPGQPGQLGQLAQLGQPSQLGQLGQLGQLSESDGRPGAVTQALIGGATLTIASTPTCAGPFKGDPEQAIVVRATGTRATLIGCSRTTRGYRRTIGPIAARVGYNGVAPAGEKQEGDGRTPSGTFRLATGFGTSANPGLRRGWLRTGSRDVWIDDSQSALYNTHQRLPVHGRWTSAERLKIPAYRFAQVIAYNTDRIPGRGSAIFMHVGTTPTTGCVALPASKLVHVMRWEHPGAVMVIS